MRDKGVLGVISQNDDSRIRFLSYFLQLIIFQVIYIVLVFSVNEFDVSDSVSGLKLLFGRSIFSLLTN